MKKLALINSYCDTWEKLTILYQNIKKLKELGIDSLVYSPISLPKEITDQSDYTILTKENPIIKWPERAMLQWARINNYRLNLIVPDYGWASIYQYKKLMEYGSTLNYDYYFWFLYDLNIDSIVEETLKNPHNKLFFKSSKSTSSQVGGIFASFNKDNINKIHPLLNKQDYIKTCNEGQIAEYYLEVICNKIEGEISSHINTDLIDEHSKLNFNKAEPSCQFKMFFTNKDNLKFIFWEFTQPEINFNLKINGNFYNYQIGNNTNIIESEIHPKDIKEIGYIHNQEYIDLSKYFKDTFEVLQVIENIN